MFTGSQILLLSAQPVRTRAFLFSADSCTCVCLFPLELTHPDPILPSLHVPSTPPHPFPPPPPAPAPAPSCSCTSSCGGNNRVRLSLRQRVAVQSSAVSACHIGHRTSVKCSPSTPTACRARPPDVRELTHHEHDDDHDVFYLFLQKQKIGAELVWLPLLHHLAPAVPVPDPSSHHQVRNLPRCQHQVKVKKNSVPAS